MMCGNVGGCCATATGQGRVVGVSAGVSLSGAEDVLERKCADENCKGCAHVAVCTHNH
jgi:hypothetical protein